jgi:hypothetical protein
MSALTKLQKRFLSRRICAWCDHRLDWPGCSAIYSKCSPAEQEKRRRAALKTYKPRLKQEGGG